MIDSIRGAKEVFELFGTRKTVRYLLDGSLKARVKDHIRNKIEKGILDLLVITAMESGVNRAIDWLNHKPFRETLFLKEEELQFFSQYFVKEKEKRNDKEILDSKFEFLTRGIPAHTRFILHGKSSKILINLIKDYSANKEIIMYYLYFLRDRHLRRLFEKYKIAFYYPLKNTCLSISNPAIKRKLLNEIEFVNNRIKAFFLSGRFDAETNSEMIGILGDIGIEKPEFFEELVMSQNNEEEIKRAAYAFWLQTEVTPLNLNDFCRIIERLNKQYYRARDKTVRRQLIIFSEELIQKFIIDPSTISMNAVKVLKIYRKLLQDIVKNGTIMPDIILQYIGDIYDNKTVAGILPIIVEKAKSLEIKSKAFNELIILNSRNRNLGWPLTSSLKKEDIKANVLKRLGIYSLYHNSVEKAISENLEESLRQRRALLTFLSICPQCSYKLIDTHLTKVRLQFQQIDKKYQREHKFVEDNFRKILSQQTPIPEKKGLVEDIRDKTFCYPQWRECKRQLEELDSLKAEIKSRLKPVVRFNNKGQNTKTK